MTYDLLNPITVETLNASHIEETMHLNGGRAWFGYGYVGVEHPRLMKIVKYFRKDRSTKVEWFVDGKPVESLEEAAMRLNFPPTISKEENEMLDRIPDEFARCRGPEFPIETLIGLSRKALVESENGLNRRRAGAVYIVEAPR